MELIVGIASTTHVDRHNERVSKSALESMSRQIREKYIPQLVNHDWDEYIGVVLYGEVFQLEDGEFALGVVCGIFEDESEKDSFLPEQKNTVWESCRELLDVDSLRLFSAERALELRTEPQFIRLRKTVANRLETYLDSTGVAPDGTVYTTKFLVTSLNDLKIEVYPHDHAPKHFHVTSKQRGIDARFSIDTLEPISTKHGTISPRDIRKIQDYFVKRPDELERLISEHTRLN